MRRPCQIRRVSSAGKRNQQGIEYPKRRQKRTLFFTCGQVVRMNASISWRYWDQVFCHIQGQYNLSRWLLKIEQDVDCPCLRIRLQDAPAFVVMVRKAAECFLRAVDNKVVVSASIEYCALWDLPCCANPPLAFERQPGKDELSHPILRSFGNGHGVGDACRLVVVVRSGC